ncbi:Cas10/Cmr2 second palm domain-containing protein [Streptobacillus canis]|uniref:Cas10/Cmr2 second palm domain-containing protein n=1 Tax=Streptobacillus canis TaxID=2678686 RepID=UPI0012E31832|nr:hypothetical protein [Streptobacillus canis]
MKKIVTVETVKIKEYIFATNKLKTIQGASYLLDYVNNVGIRKILKKFNIIAEADPLLNYGEIEKIFKSNEDILKQIEEKVMINDSKLNGELIYIAAGNAKFIIDETVDYNALKKEIEYLYKFVAPGSKIMMEYIEISDKDDISEKIGQLSTIVNQKKNNGFKIENLDLPFIEKCDFSNNELAEIDFEKYLEEYYGSIDNNNYIDNLISKQFKHDYVFQNIVDIILPKIDHYDIIDKLEKIKVRKISLESYMKYIFSEFFRDNDKEFESFYTVIKNKIPGIKFEDEIEAFKDDKSFVGFMYADGDGLGEFLKNKSKEISKLNISIEEKNQEYLKFIKPFSILLDYITKSSLVDTLVEIKKIRENKIQNDNKNENKNDNLFGAFFIVGGDDVCALFKSNEIIDIATKYSEIFSDKMRKINYNQISTSSGVLFVKNKVPFHLMLKQSLVLQKNAKKERFKNIYHNINEDNRVGYIDFLNIASEGNVNIDEFLKKYKENKKVIERPYKASKLKKLKDFIDEISELKENDRISNSSLRQILEYKLDDKLELQRKNIRILNKFFKYSETSQNKLKELWKEIENDINLKKIESKNYCNNILDIVELYDFVGEENEKN